MPITQKIDELVEAFRQPGEGGVSETMRKVATTSCASSGRFCGITPSKTISAASSTVNSVKSMKLEK